MQKKNMNLTIVKKNIDLIISLKKSKDTTKHEGKSWTQQNANEKNKHTTIF